MKWCNFLTLNGSTCQFHYKVILELNLIRKMTGGDIYFNNTERRQTLYNTGEGMKMPKILLPDSGPFECPNGSQHLKRQLRSESQTFKKCIHLNTDCIIVRF